MIPICILPLPLRLPQAINIAAFSRPCLSPERCLVPSFLDLGVIGDVVQIVASSEMLFSEDSQLIFNALLALYERASDIDPIILREELIRRDTLKESGGTAH